MNGNAVVQPATPSLAKITVADLLQTSLTVRQLTPEQIRARGIVVDARNYDVYEYTFTLLVNGETIHAPFPVIVDPRTHVVTPVREERGYGVPNPVKNVQPPRWTSTSFRSSFPTSATAAFQTRERPPPEKRAHPSRPEIPAALVLHQYTDHSTGRTVRIDSKLLAGSAGVVLYTDSITH